MEETKKSEVEVASQKEKSSEIAKISPKSNVMATVSQFSEWMQVANTLSKSTVIPSAYQNNPSNCLIALELSGRIGVSPMMVMQNLDIIKGKPSWSGAFIIAAINSCGRFEPLKFVFEGEPKTDSYGCRAVTKDMNGNEVRSTLIDWKMVKAEGWLQKAGSKWASMAEQMFQYRSASFFGRVHCPDILFGMQSVEEVIDVVGVVVEEIDIESLQELYMEVSDALTPEEDSRASEIIKNKEKSNYKKLEDFLNGKKEQPQ